MRAFIAAAGLTLTSAQYPDLIATALLATVEPPPTMAPLPLYDCNAEFYMWETAWTPDWKAWCCSNQGVGCATTITVTETSTVSSTTRTRTHTKTHTRTATETSTKTRTGTTTHTTTATPMPTKTTTKAPAPTTTEAPAPTTTEAPAPTTTEAPAPTTTEAPAPTTTETPAPTTTKAPAPTTTKTPATTLAATTTAERKAAPSCKTWCDFKAINATCNERIQWATVHETASEVSPCEAARVLVMMECPVCGGCSLHAACNITDTFHFDFLQRRDTAPKMHRFVAGFAWLPLIGAAVVGAASLLVAVRRSSRPAAAIAAEAERTSTLYLRAALNDGDAE